MLAHNLVTRHYKPAGTYKPGDVVYVTTSRTTVTLSDFNAAAGGGQAYSFGVIGIRKGHEVDTAYATTDWVPVHEVSGSGAVVPVKIKDHGAAAVEGELVVVGDTAGELEVTDTLTDLVVGTLFEPIANGDTIALVRFH
jgi:hypothetical protein